MKNKGNNDKCLFVFAGISSIITIALLIAKIINAGTIFCLTTIYK